MAILHNCKILFFANFSVLTFAFSKIINVDIFLGTIFQLSKLLSVMSVFKKCRADRFSRFDVYWIQTTNDRQKSKVYIYVLYIIDRRYGPLIMFHFMKIMTLLLRLRCLSSGVKPLLLVCT